MCFAALLSPDRTRLKHLGAHGHDYLDLRPIYSELGKVAKQKLSAFACLG